MRNQITGMSVVALGALALVGPPLHAQQPVPPPPASRTWVGVEAGRTTFSDSTAPWTLGALSLERRGEAGTFIGRATTARRYGLTGTQLEADAYPRLPGLGYAYLSAGWSESAIFPRWRAGAELFAALPHAVEASVGVRHLRFDAENVTLLTGSLGRYAGEYYVSLRPFVRAKDGVVTGAAGLTARRYFATADDYVGVRAGAGTSPDERTLATDLSRSRFTSADLHGSRALTPRVVATGTLGWQGETLAAARTRHRWELGAGTRIAF